jgi:hypothetical protein
MAMEKKKLALVAVILLAGLCCSEAFALSPMGTPTAGLSQGRLALGAEYSQSELGIDFDFSSATAPMPDFTKTKFGLDMITGRIGYGLTDTWEAFGNIGEADVDSSEDMEKHSADGMVYGFGTKVTFLQMDKLKLGVSAQAKWAELDGDATGPGWTGDLELDIMQIQLVAGPTYELMEQVCIYGGPLWYYLDGEKRYYEPGWYEKYDMSNMSDFGGYIGGHVGLGDNINFNIEYQFTGDDDALGLNLLWMF